MSSMASQITSLTILYSIVYSGADQRKLQSSAPLALVWGIHRSPVNSPHKGPVTRKILQFDDVIMFFFYVENSKNIGNQNPMWVESWLNLFHFCFKFFICTINLKVLYRTRHLTMVLCAKFRNVCSSNWCFKRTTFAKLRVMMNLVINVTNGTLSVIGHW